MTGCVAAGDGLGRGHDSAGDLGGVLVERSASSTAVASWSQLANVGCVLAEHQRAAAASKSRWTSRTWQAYSSGDQTWGEGRTAASSVPSTTSHSVALSRIACGTRVAVEGRGVEAALGARAVQDPGPVLGVGLDRHGCHPTSARGQVSSSVSSRRRTTARPDQPHHHEVDDRHRRRPA